MSKSIHKTVSLIILFIFLSIYYILSASGVISGDDLLYTYKFSFNPVSDAPWPLIHEKIESVTDIIYSQYVHWFLMNGRTLIHTIVQIFVSFSNMPVFALFSTAMFLAFIILYSIECFPTHSSRLSILFVFSILVVMCVPEKNIIYISLVGAINYLWPMSVILFFLFMLRRNIKSVSGKTLFILLGLCAGWSHEALSIPVATALFFYLIVERKHIPLYTKIAVLFFFIGCCLLTFAPGNWIKFLDSNQSSLYWKAAVYKRLTTFLYLRITYFLVPLSIYLYKKGLFKDFLYRNIYHVLAFLTAIAFILAIGPINSRSVFFVDMIAGVLIGRALTEFIDIKAIEKVSYWVAYLMIPIAIWIVPYHVSINHNKEILHKKLSTSKERNIVLQMKRVQVPFLLKSFVPSQGDIPRYNSWSKKVQIFAYQKESVEIKWVND